MPKNSISKGYDPGYYLRVTAAGKENYYTSAVAAGLEPAGRWAGRGLEALGLEPGSVVDPDTLRHLFTKRWKPGTKGAKAVVLGRAPYKYDQVKLDEKIEATTAELVAVEAKALGIDPARVTARRRRELQFVAKAKCSRDHVNFYDYSFSVPKSVSLLQAGWTADADKARAAGDLARAAECDAKAEEIERAVITVAQSIVRMAEQHVYVRTGHHDSAGVGQVQDTAGLTAAIFPHHTARTAAGEPCGDPQLHVHITFWAYAQPAPDADVSDPYLHRSIAADGLYQMRSHYSAVAQLELEQRLQRLGYAIVRRPDGDFEVSGLHQEKLLKAFSARSAEIAKELEPRRQEFRDRFGREPAQVMQRSMARDATMKTRQSKDYAPDRALQLAVWEAKYQKVAQRALDEIPQQATDAAHARSWAGFDAVQRERCIALALATLQKQRSTWNWAHLSLELVKTLDILSPGEVPPEAVEDLVLGMVREALSGGDVVLLKPPPAVDMPGTRHSGEPVWSRPSEFSRWATVEHLLAEGRLLDDAARPAEPVLSPERAARAAGSTLERMEAERARQAADTGAGQEPGELSADGLSNDQAMAVYGLLTSAKAVNVLIGAAGTGKSHVVGRLAKILQRETGRRVVGVTAGQAQAEVLKGEGLDDAFNIADFVGQLEGTEERRGHLPLHAGDWLVVDEASAADRATLAELNEIAKARGARMLLTGDPEQSGSVGAGGTMRAIASEHGFFELHQVLRFREAWEGPASVRLRAGDTTVIREYIERGRVIEGTEEEVTASLVKQYTGSLVAGRAAVLLTDANAGAEELAGMVRDQLIGLGEVDGEGPAVELADGNKASRGDLVRAMKNAKGIGPGGRRLTNRDVLVIDRVADGYAEARRLIGLTPDGQREYGPQFTIPDRYLGTETALAYGGNVWVATGRTVEDSYDLRTDATSRKSLYVALTRGTGRNVVGAVTVRGTDDPLIPGREPQPRVVTAESLLTATVEREPDDLTAAEYLRQQQEAEYSMPSLVGRWQALTREDRFAAYDEIMRELIPGDAYKRLEMDPERGTLNRDLRAVELAGGDGAAVLREAIGQRDFTGAKSVAGVLHGRVTRLAGPVSHKALDGYAAATPELDDPHAAEAARELARLADERTGELGAQAAAEQPVWALNALGDLPPDPVLRDEWVTAAGKVAAYRELASYKDPVNPVGPAPEAGAVERRAAWRAAADAAGLSKEDQGIRETSEMILLARDREAVRLRGFAPADVTEERQVAELAKGSVVADARMAMAAARNAQLESEAQALRDLAVSHQQLADEVSVHAASLAERDELRRDWDAKYDAKLTRGAQGRGELERRREAGELSDRRDVVEAWLDRDDSGKAEPESADEPEVQEPRAAREPEADPEAGAEPAAGREPGAEAQPAETGHADPRAERAEHYRQVAEHRDQAVEHAGRAMIEEAKAAQARMDQRRAEETAERDAPSAQPEAGAEADFEAGS